MRGIRSVFVALLLLTGIGLHAQITHKFPALDTNNTFTGINTTSGSGQIVANSIFPCTFALCPSAASMVGRTIVITDALVAGACDAGGGTQQALCRSNGTSYVALGGNGGVVSAGGGGPNFGTTFTSQTSVTIPGSTHDLGTKNLIVECYDDASPANLIHPASITVDGTTDNVTVGFASAQSGYCVVNGSGPHRYATTFASQTTVTVPGTTHQLGTADLDVTVYDAATGTRNKIVPASVAIDSTTFDVTVTFAMAQSGRLVIQ